MIDITNAERDKLQKTADSLSDADTVSLTQLREQKEELTLLALMEEVPRAQREAKAKELLVPWKEYKRYVRKYREVLKRHRMNNKTYEGEFEDGKPGETLSMKEIERGHEILEQLFGKGVMR